MDGFEVLGEITDRERIAVGRSIRDRRRLVRVYGRGRWRKMKGRAWVRLPSGTEALAELHWYEAHGIGVREVKIKCLL